MSVGDRYGRLTVIGILPTGAVRGSAICRCDCGETLKVQYRHLRHKAIQSCGCLHDERFDRTTHGEASNGKETPEYLCWRSMLKRCYVPTIKHFHLYGGRGISVCPAWRESYQAFLADVGRRPSAIHSIDRINNNGNYEPGNVRWATRREQGRNRRDTLRIVVEGVEVSVADAAEKAGLERPTVVQRLKAGWSIERALSTPSMRAR